MVDVFLIQGSRTVPVRQHWLTNQLSTRTTTTTTTTITTTLHWQTILRSCEPSLMTFRHGPRRKHFSQKTSLEQFCCCVTLTFRKHIPSLAVYGLLFTGRHAATAPCLLASSRVYQSLCSKGSSLVSHFVPWATMPQYLIYIYIYIYIYVYASF
jgi:hypothetical protein